MSSAAQPKIDYSDILYAPDGWYYIGDVKITGVAMRRTSVGKTQVFTENRVAMTKNEQKKTWVKTALHATANVHWPKWTNITP